MPFIRRDSDGAIIDTCDHARNDAIEFLDAEDPEVLRFVASRAADSDIKEQLNISDIDMARVVEDLISLSRIEAEKFTAPTDAVDLEQLIEVAVEAASRMAADRGSKLICRLEPDLPRIAADGSQILQVLDNLITNALRYGGAGTPVTVSADREGEMVHVSVADQGEGIAPEHIKRLTERFYRVDASRSRALGGTGLGLSIVKHIVERHRGRLSIESDLGKGTTVHVLLPVAAGSSVARLS